RERLRDRGPVPGAQLFGAPVGTRRGRPARAPEGRAGRARPLGGRLGDGACRRPGDRERGVARNPEIGNDPARTARLTPASPDATPAASTRSFIAAPSLPWARAPANRVDPRSRPSPPRAVGDVPAPRASRNADSGPRHGSRPGP